MSTKKKDDLGQAEVQATYDEHAKRGYIGTVPPQPPNEAYSVQTGPDSPTPLEQHIALHDSKGDEMRASTAGGAKQEDKS